MEDTRKGIYTYQYAREHGLLSTWSDRPLKNHKYAMVFVSRDRYGAITVRSYATEIFHIDRYGYLSMEPKAFSHSPTTSRHIRWAISELAPKVTTEMARQICNECLSVNIDTGEISDRTRYNGR